MDDIIDMKAWMLKEMNESYRYNIIENSADGGGGLILQRTWMHT